MLTVSSVVPSEATAGCVISNEKMNNNIVIKQLPITSKSRVLLLVFVVVIVLFSYLYTNTVSDKSLLKMKGTTTLGIVLSTKNKSNNTVVEYDFEINGQYYHNTQSSTKRYIKGDTISITYIPEKPKVNHITDDLYN